jgi:hypothetical protein
MDVRISGFGFPGALNWLSLSNHCGVTTAYLCKPSELREYPIHDESFRLFDRIVMFCSTEKVIATEIGAIASCQARVAHEPVFEA